MSLRLEKLPDRTPVRMTIAVDPDLASALADYAEIYHQIYGEATKPEVLVPAMLGAFLDSDTAFRRARKALRSNSGKEG